jgi:hypothetical protein
MSFRIAQVATGKKGRPTFDLSNVLRADSFWLLPVPAFVASFGSHAPGLPCFSRALPPATVGANIDIGLLDLPSRLEASG